MNESSTVIQSGPQTLPNRVTRIRMHQYFKQRTYVFHFSVCTLTEIFCSSFTRDEFETVWTPPTIGIFYFIVAPFFHKTTIVMVVVFDNFFLYKVSKHGVICKQFLQSKRVLPSKLNAVILIRTVESKTSHTWGANLRISIY